MNVQLNLINISKQLCLIKMDKSAK